MGLTYLSACFLYISILLTIVDFMSNQENIQSCIWTWRFVFYILACVMSCDSHSKLTNEEKNYLNIEDLLTIYAGNHLIR